MEGSTSAVETVGRVSLEAGELDFAARLVYAGLVERSQDTRRIEGLMKKRQYGKRGRLSDAETRLVRRITDQVKDRRAGIIDESDEYEDEYIGNHAWDYK